MRLFVGLWPPPPVLDALEALPRTAHPELRWTTRDQWHVTLRFLGEVADGDLPGLQRSLQQRLAAHAAVELSIGPAVVQLGPRRGVLAVPVAGADVLVTAVAEASTGFGGAPDPRPFRGHLTLARARRGRTVPFGSGGEVIHATWLADRVALVQSRLEADGARYQTLLELPLVAPASP